MREQLSVQCHYQHLLTALDEMTELANGDINQESKDRFAMLSVIADKHWRVVEKYLPLMQVDVTQHESAGPKSESRLREVVQGLLGDRHAETTTADQPVAGLSRHYG